MIVCQNSLEWYEMNKYAIARELEEKGDYQSALELYNQVDGTDKDRALYRIGQMYRKGHGCEVNYAKAIDIFSELARRNVVEGEYMLGLLYFEGEGVQQDYNLAMHWHTRAGLHGSKYAQYSVGIMYENGWGCIADNYKAFDWHYKSALQEYGTAQYRVACHYYFGLSVQQDLKKAKEWFKKSSDNGFIESKYNLACILLDENRDLDLALALLKDAVKADHWRSAYNLYLCSQYGIGMKPDSNYLSVILEQLSENSAKSLLEKIELGGK